MKDLDWYGKKEKVVQSKYDMDNDGKKDFIFVDNKDMFAEARPD